MADKKFAEGIYFQRKSTAPSFVIGGLSVKVVEFSQFIQQNSNNAGYCNLDIKQGKSGKYYVELNQWQPTKDKVKEEEKNQSDLNNWNKKEIKDEQIEYPEEDINPEDIPF